MPWKECNLMDERVRFVARLLEGEEIIPAIFMVTGLFARYPLRQNKQTACVADDHPYVQCRQHNQYSWLLP